MIPNPTQAREEGLSQWEGVLKGQAKETSETAEALEADRLSLEKQIQERSAALEADERRLVEENSALGQRKKAIADREAELRDLEGGREARSAELERVRDRLAGVEKGLETERVDIARRKVGRPLSKGGRR